MIVYSLLSDCIGWQHGNTHSPQGCGGLLSFPMSSERWNLELPLCTGLQCRASTCSYKWLQHLSLFWKWIFGFEQDILESHNSNAYGMWLSLLANMNLGGKRVQTTSYWAHVGSSRELTVSNIHISHANISDQQTRSHTIGIRTHIFLIAAVSDVLCKWVCTETGNTLYCSYLFETDVQHERFLTEKK